jgi:hypothetical protein
MNSHSQTQSLLYAPLATAQWSNLSVRDPVKLETVCIIIYSQSVSLVMDSTMKSNRLSNKTTQYMVLAD